MAQRRSRSENADKVSVASNRTFASQSGAEEVVGKKPLNGYFTTIIHFIKGYVGTGIFAMGQGYKNSGLLFGSVFLFLIALMNLNCQHILIKASMKISDEEEDEDVKPSFAETVEYTLETSKLACLRRNAKGLAIATNIFLCVAELGFCCVYFVFIADHLEQIAINHNLLQQYVKTNSNIVLAIILIPMWATTFLGNLKLLLPLSVIANILAWVGISIILYFATYEGLGPISERNLISSIDRIPRFFGVVLFAFEGITFIIPLRNEMKHPRQFTSTGGVLNIGMLVVLVLYFLVGFLTYWKWGEDVKASAFLNITGEDKTMSDITFGIMVVTIAFTFTLHMYIPFEISFPLFYRRYGPFKHGKLVMGVYRSVPVLFTYLLANVVPFLGLFIELIGATVGSFLVLIMPPLLELVAVENLSVIMIIKNWIIIAVGVIGTILGTALSLKGIIEKFEEKYITKE